MHIALGANNALNVVVLDFDIFAVVDVHAASSHHVARHAGGNIGRRRPVLVGVYGRRRAGNAGGKIRCPSLAVGHGHVGLGSWVVVRDIVGSARGQRRHSGAGNGTAAVIVG